MHLQQPRYRIGIQDMGCHRCLGLSHAVGPIGHHRASIGAVWFVSQGVIATLSTPSR